MAGLSIFFVSLLSASPVFLSPSEAQELLKKPVTILDARGDQATAPFLPHAAIVDWKETRRSWGREGRLKSPEKVAEYYQEKGVSSQKPVLVYGAAHQAWGEEARIWWELKYLGHSQVYILDGGIAAWQKKRLTTQTKRLSKIVPGKFLKKIDKELRQSTKTLAKSLSDYQLIDTRTQQEYQGATPYYSARGGHIPGAKWLHWKALLNTEGRLLPAAQLSSKLKAAGLSPDKPTVAYCTGGVRSAFVAAVLIHLNYAPVANYDGSWWAWAANKQLPAHLGPR